MIKRAWTYGLATLALCYVACDSGRTAGSSMETENSIALQVQLADGTPAARMDVIVRPESYLSGASELGSDSLYQLHSKPVEFLPFRQLHDSLPPHPDSYSSIQMPRFPIYGPCPHAYS